MLPRCRLPEISVVVLMCSSRSLIADLCGGLTAQQRNIRVFSGWAKKGKGLCVVLFFRGGTWLDACIDKGYGIGILGCGGVVLPDYLVSDLCLF